MNRSFDFVMRSTLNNSKSKEAHQFPQSKRFNYPKPPHCRQDSYDLSKTMLASQIGHSDNMLPRQERFRSRKSCSPSPDAYHHRSFVDLNTATDRGNMFANDLRMKADEKKKRIPGPGTYEVPNPEKKLAYTMRSRVNIKDHGSKLGPGQYQIDTYEALNKTHQIASKYANAKQITIGTDQRFKDKHHQTPGPGPFRHSRTNHQVGNDPRFSFGQMKKEPSYIKKTLNPGPGSYNEFSEFSELKGGFNSKSSRLIKYQ